ncbi:hypothetical protein ABG067_003248 [Albugo candida]
MVISESRWGDEDDDFLPTRTESEPDKNGVRTIVEWKFNDLGQKVKITKKVQRVEEIHRISKRVLERKNWKKFGAALQGNDSNVTYPSNETVYMEDPNADQILPGEKREEESVFAGVKGASIITCRHCGIVGDHWTLKCPYKDTPPGEIPTGINSGADEDTKADADTTESTTESSLSRAFGGGPDKYVPPNLRNRGDDKGESYANDTDNATLRVTNISPDTCEDDLYELFRVFGHVLRVYLARDRETLQSRGFAFVSFARVEDAERALDKLQGYGYDHLILKLEWARPSNKPREEDRDAIDALLTKLRCTSFRVSPDDRKWAELVHKSLQSLQNPIETEMLQFYMDTNCTRKRKSDELKDWEEWDRDESHHLTMETVLDPAKWKDVEAIALALSTGLTSSERFLEVFKVLCLHYSMNSISISRLYRSMVHTLKIAKRWSWLQELSPSLLDITYRKIQLLYAEAKFAEEEDEVMFNLMETVLLWCELLLGYQHSSSLFSSRKYQVVGLLTHLESVNDSVQLISVRMKGLVDIKDSNAIACQIITTVMALLMYHQSCPHENKNIYGLIIALGFSVNSGAMKQPRRDLINVPSEKLTNLLRQAAWILQPEKLTYILPFFEGKWEADWIGDKGFGTITNSSYQKHFGTLYMRSVERYLTYHVNATIHEASNFTAGKRPLQFRGYIFRGNDCLDENSNASWTFESHFGYEKGDASLNQWKCLSCAFVNKASALFCITCGKPAPSKSGSMTKSSAQDPLSNAGFSRGIFFGKDKAFLRVHWSRGEETGVWLARKCETKKNFSLGQLYNSLAEVSYSANVFANEWNPDHVVMIENCSLSSTPDMTIEFWMLPKQADGFQVILSSRDNVVYLTPRNNLIWQVKKMHTIAANSNETQQNGMFLDGGTMNVKKFTHVSLTMEKNGHRLIRIDNTIVADSQNSHSCDLKVEDSLEEKASDQRSEALENLLFLGGKGHLHGDFAWKISDCFGGAISDLRIWSLFAPFTEQLPSSKLSLYGNELNLLGYYPLVGNLCRVLMDKSNAQNHASLASWCRENLSLETTREVEGSPLCQVHQYPVQDGFVKEIGSLLIAGHCELCDDATLQIQRAGLGSSVWLNDPINIREGFHVSLTIREESGNTTSPSPLLLGICNNTTWELSSCLREAKVICDNLGDTCTFVESSNALMTTTSFFVVIRRSSTSTSDKCICDIAIFVWRAQKAFQICRASHISINAFTTMSIDYSAPEHVFKVSIEGTGTIIESVIDLESALVMTPKVNDTDSGSARFGIIFPNLENTILPSVYLTEWLVNASVRDTNDAIHKDIPMDGLAAIYPHLARQNSSTHAGKEDRDNTIPPLTLCSRIRFDDQAIQQETYGCQTCSLDHGTLCRTCAVICHSGHDLIATGAKSISCACQSRGSDLCQCTTQTPKFTVDLFPALESGTVAHFWRCDQCTIVNEANAVACKVCGRNTTISPARDTADTPMLNTSSDGTLCESAKHAFSEWSCVACTMLNEPNAKKCAVCETVRLGHSPHTGGKETQSRGQLTPFHTDSAGITTESPNDPSESHWDCQACTMQNPASNVCCYMCTTARENSQTEANPPNSPDTSTCEALQTPSTPSQNITIERNTIMERNVSVLSTLYADILPDEARKNGNDCDFVGESFWETTIGNMLLNTSDHPFTSHYVNSKCEGDGSIHGIAYWAHSSGSWRLRGAYRKKSQSLGSAIDIQWNSEGSRFEGKLHCGNAGETLNCTKSPYTCEFRGLKKVLYECKGEKSVDSATKFQPFYCGLLNMQDSLTNICYQNSYLQALFMTKAFRHLILEYTTNDREQANKESVESVNKSITSILQDIFVKLLCSQRPFIATRELQKCIPSEFNSGQQQDTSDFAHYLMDAVSSEVAHDHIFASKLAQIFGGLQATIVTCKKCEKHSMHEEYFWELLLNMVDLKYTPIVDICAVSGDASHIETPEGYERLNFDLNQGRTGSPPHVFLCVKRAPEKKQIENDDSVANLPVTEIVLRTSLTIDAAPCMPSEYERVGVNLNVGGSSLNDNKRQIYMFFRRDPNGSPITDLHVLYRNEPLPDGYNLLDTDLNMGDGDNVFLCYRCDMPITDIKLVDSNVSGYSLSPESLVLKGPTTNSQHAGEQYLAYKVGGGTDVCVTDLTVVSESRSKELKQRGWECIGVLGNTRGAVTRNDAMEDNDTGLDTRADDSSEEYNSAAIDHVMVLRGHGNPIVAIDVYRAPRQVPKFSDYEIQSLYTHLDATKNASNDTSSRVERILATLEGNWKATEKSDQSHRFMVIDPFSTVDINLDEAYLVQGHWNDKDEIFAVAIPIRKPMVTWGPTKEKLNNAHEPDSGDIGPAQAEDTITSFRLTGYVRDASRSSEPHVMQFDLTTPQHEDLDSFCTVLGNMGDGRGMLLPFSAIQRSKKPLLKRVATSLVLLRGDESIPENVDVVRTTVSGNTGNLLAQSKSPHSLYVGVTRDPSSKHYVDDVCVIYGEVDAVPERCICVETTPAGHSANLNDGTSGVTMFICYRLASIDEQTEESQTVMDVALVCSSQGHSDAIPPNFYKVTQTPLGLSANLNEGTQGAMMFLCVQKRLLHEVPRIIHHPMNGRYEILSFGNGPPLKKYLNLCVTRMYTRAYPIKGGVGPTFHGRASMHTVRGILCVDDAKGASNEKIIGLWTPNCQGQFMASLPVFPFELTLKGSDAEMEGWYSSPDGSIKPNVLTIKTPGSKTSNAIGSGRAWCLRKDSYVQIAFKKDYGSEWKDGKLISSERVWRHDIPSMLKRFTATRTMGGLDALSCSRCQEKTESRTHTVIVSPPDHLVLTLKRMYYDVKQQKTQKCLRDVAFPAFLTLPDVSFNDEEIIHASKERNQIHKSHDRDYGLYAVLIHSGLTANSGHYYSFCRVSDGNELHLDDSEANPWIKFNDTNVEFSSMKEIHRTTRSVSDSVYLLLYKKLNYKVEFEIEGAEGDETLLLAKAMALSMSAATDSVEIVCSGGVDVDARGLDRNLVAKVEQENTRFLHHLEKFACSEEQAKVRSTKFGRKALMAGQDRSYQKDAPSKSWKKSQSRSKGKHKRVDAHSDIVDRRKRAREHMKARQQANANRLHGEEVKARKQKLCREVAAKIVWRKFERKNEAFETFYKQLMQKMYFKCDNFDAIWTSFIDCMKKSLCVHFRFNLNQPDLAHQTLHVFQHEIIPKYVAESHRQRVSEDVSGEERTIQIAPLAWASFANENLWKVSVDAKQFRKEESLMEICAFVHENTKFGLLIRHDPTISLLPELLSIRPSDRVLDLCGGAGEHGIRAPVLAECLRAPGSQGVLVVNETSVASGAIALRNLSRTLTCSANVIVTTHRILDYPQMENTHDGFDRVLCMVPCSGDGMIRSCPEKWRTWTVSKGNENHQNQINQLTKAISLLKVGGTVLYCTRSMNPIENEAVVTAVLDNGLCKVELIDIHRNMDEKFPAFLKHPGVESWAVFGEDMQILPSWKDLNDKDKSRLNLTMWPKANMKLDRCVRVLPHENDTHAFFFAALRKCTAEAIPTVSAAPKADKPQYSDRRKHISSSKHFAPLKRLNWEKMIEFYGLELPPHWNQDSFLQKRQSIQNGQCSVHLVSHQAVSILTSRHIGKLAVQRAGVEAFHLSVSTSRAEITDAGAQTLTSALTKQILGLQLGTFEKLLEGKELWNHQLPALTLEHAEALEDGPFVAAIETPRDPNENIIGLITCVKHQNGISLAASPDLNYNRSRLLFLLSRFNKAKK